MGAINPTYNNRVKYLLSHKDYGTLVITEPIGWRTDEKEYARNKNYHGIFAKFSNSLKFIRDGAEYISVIRNIYGINADIRLTRDEKHPHTDEWIRSYDGFLDLSTYSIQDGKVSVKFNASGLEKILKARESEKVEIERLNTIDGSVLPSLQTKNVLLDGRRIFLKSIYDVENSNNYARMFNQTIGNTRGTTVTVPMHLSVKSHENAQSPIPNTSFGDNSHGRTGNGTTGIMFFASSNGDRTFRIKFTISFKFNRLQHDDTNWEKFWFRLATYKNGTDYIYKDAINIYYNDNNLGSIHNQILTFSFDQHISVLDGESLSLQFCQLMDGRNLYSAHLSIHLTDIICNLSIEEDSFFEKSNSKIILAHELGERLVQIATNRDDAFYSEALGRTELGYSLDGEASLTGFAHGHWVRGFDKLPENEENKYKSFATSFKDYIQNLDVVWNLGLGIERIGFKEIIRIEKLEYFYNKNVTIKLPNQVKKVKRSEAKNLYYSGLEFGFTKGGEYEEAMGLDEFNTKSTFTTIINRVKKLYRKVSKYRADAYGMEFARRKQKSEYPTEDSRYDNDVFILDLKRLYGNVFEQRKWQDDFTQEPTGIFSPETATNLRFSPFNILLRHSWFFASGLTKYLTDYIRYGSSNANSNLSTKLNGGIEYSENGNIVNSELKKPRFVNEWVEFEHIADFEIMQQVEGFTIILGKKIPNYYGLVQFINEENKTEKGYLFNLKPNGSGKWKLLKANR